MPHLKLEDAIQVQICRVKYASIFQLPNNMKSWIATITVTIQLHLILLAYLRVRTCPLNVFFQYPDVISATASPVEFCDPMNLPPPR